jgi:hypothetical protein
MENQAVCLTLIRDNCFLQRNNGICENLLSLTSHLREVLPALPGFVFYHSNFCIRNLPPLLSPRQFPAPSWIPVALGAILIEVPQDTTVVADFILDPEVAFKDGFE